MYILAVFTRLINVDEARACTLGSCLDSGEAPEPREEELVGTKHRGRYDLEKK